jgi:hypothetical protein
MFDDARDDLLGGVRGLNDWLAREFDKMIEAVQRNASVAADNLVAGDRMTAGGIAEEQVMLDELANLVNGRAIKDR